MVVNIKGKIEDIGAWDHSRCLDEWIAMTGAASGSRLSLRFLRKALTFEMQSKELGGHSAAIRRQFRAGTGAFTRHAACAGMEWAGLSGEGHRGWF